MRLAPATPFCSTACGTSSAASNSGCPAFAADCFGAGHRRLGSPVAGWRRCAPLTRMAGRDARFRRSHRLTCLLLGAKSLLPFRESSVLRAGRGVACGPALGSRRPRDGTPAGVAQLVEHLPCKQGVRGSSPLVSSGRSLPRRSDFRNKARCLEGCPSGQREQTVNLPAHAFDGSNPSPSTGPSPPPGSPGSWSSRRAHRIASRGRSSVGRASAFQAERRRFEPGRPLPEAVGPRPRTPASRPPSSVGRARPW